jgi:hypothetical protein
MAADIAGIPYESAKSYQRKGLLPLQEMGRLKVIDPDVLRAVLVAAGYRPRRKK